MTKEQKLELIQNVIDYINCFTNSDEKVTWGEVKGHLENYKRIHQSL